MKKRNKLILGSFLLLGSSLVLTGCTQSFCSNEDQAKMLYSFDYGATRYFNSEEERNNYETYLNTGKSYKSYIQVKDTAYYTLTDYASNENLNSIIATAKTSKISIPTNAYYYVLDNIIFEQSTQCFNDEDFSLEKYCDARLDDGITSYTLKSDYGFTKFYQSDKGDSVFSSLNYYNNLIKDYISCKKEMPSSNKIFNYGVCLSELTVDNTMSDDFMNLYTSSMSQLVASYRSCFTIYDGYYGDYNGKPIFIKAKTYKEAWDKGLFEGLLVYPIGALVDVFANLFTSNSTPLTSGIPQFLSILLVTIIVRGLMLLVTFKQTTSSSKMQALQPQIAKIQAKYPNSNTNQYEKQRMAQETADLYKKNGINPLTSLLVLIVQFPVFICVWGALQNSAVLSTGTFLGLKLSAPLSSVLFNKASWSAGGGAVTALILFILMAGSQTVSMLLPQWMQKAERKNIAKLGRNPAQKSQDSKTKWFTYIMLVMIIVMGFSLVSALGVYWFVGALVSIAQTLITNAVMKKKKNKKN